MTQPNPDALPDSNEALGASAPNSWFSRPVKIYCSKNGIVRYSATIEEGFLPVFSVDSDEEALALILSVCGQNPFGELVDPRVSEGQDLDDLYALSNRLHVFYLEGDAS